MGLFNGPFGAIARPARTWCVGAPQATDRPDGAIANAIAMLIAEAIA
jgi:hypothetical protein